MDNIVHRNIRSKLNLKKEPQFLPLFLLQNLTIIALGSIISYVYYNSAYSAMSIPLWSALIFRNFSYMHDASHNAVSENKFINNFVGIIAGAICLLPFEPWRKSHLEHHIWAGNIDKDPVTAIITAFPKMHKYLRGTLSFFWRSWFPMLACMQYIVFWWLAAKTYLKRPSSMANLVSLAAPAVLWTSMFQLLPTYFSIYVLAPSIIVYMVAVEVVNLPHHLQLPQNRGNTKLQLWDQYKIARTCIYPRWFARLVVLNFNYHIEHHLFPDVPWYHLDKVHKEVSAWLGHEYNSDPYFKWIIDNKPLPISSVILAKDTKATQKSSPAA